MDPVATEVPVAMLDKTQGLSNDTLKGTYIKVTGGPFSVASIMPTEFQASCGEKAAIMPAMNAALTGNNSATIKKMTTAARESQNI